MSNIERYLVSPKQRTSKRMMLTDVRKVLKEGTEYWWKGNSEPQRELT